MIDPRVPKRHKTLLGGIIVHGPARLTLDCTIRDLSDFGAHLRMSAVVHLAKPVALLALSLDSAFEAVVAWQDGKELGLNFTGRLDLQSPTSDLEKLARRLWLERLAR